MSLLGSGELWMDPLGNNSSTYECGIHIGEHDIEYSWQHEGANQNGVISFRADDIAWVDSWHQKESVVCEEHPAHGAIFVVGYEYGNPELPRWRWRIGLCRRPDNNLVIQMTNIAPWGEEARAVRMIFTAKEPNS